MVARSLLTAVQSVARRELDSEDWLRLAATVGGRSLEQMRVLVLEFLDAEVYDVSNDSCTAFLDPLVESWDIHLDDLRLEITLRRELAADPVERSPSSSSGAATRCPSPGRSRRVPRRRRARR